MGQRDGLSYYDIMKLERMYECDRKQNSHSVAATATATTPVTAANSNNNSPGRFQFGRQLLNNYISPQFWQRLFNSWFLPQPQPQRHRNYNDNSGYLFGFQY